MNSPVKLKLIEQIPTIKKLFSDNIKRINENLIVDYNNEFKKTEMFIKNKKELEDYRREAVEIVMVLRRDIGNRFSEFLDYIKFLCCYNEMFDDFTFSNMSNNSPFITSPKDITQECKNRMLSVVDNLIVKEKKTTKKGWLNFLNKHSNDTPSISGYMVNDVIRKEFRQEINMCHRYYVLLRSYLKIISIFDNCQYMISTINIDDVEITDDMVFDRCEFKPNKSVLLNEQSHWELFLIGLFTLKSTEEIDQYLVDHLSPKRKED